MTSVVSNQKGTLLIAGGGGGAFSHGNGNAGGSAASVIDGNAGQAGMAGGGAGYQGGTFICMISVKRKIKKYLQQL